MDDIDMEFKQRVLEHLRVRAEEARIEFGVLITFAEMNLRLFGQEWALVKPLGFLKLPYTLPFSEMNMFSLSCPVGKK